MTKKEKKIDKPLIISDLTLARAFPALFLVSLSLLIFQITITRVFSAILLYHYVFAVTSFAILGLGLGGILVFILPRLEKSFMANPDLFLARLGLMLAFSYFVIITLLSLTPFLGFLSYIILGFIPFIIGGILIAILFKHAARATGKLYFADLLGSGIGSLAVIYFLDSFGLIRTFILISLTAAGASLIMFRKNVRNKIFFSCIFLTLFLLALFFQTSFTGNLETNFQPFVTSPHKYVGDTNRERGDGAARIIFTKWNSFSRTDVIDVDGDPDRKTVTIDGVAFSGMYRFNGDLRQVKNYTDTSGYFPSIMSLPFLIGSNEKVAMIGTGGGRDVLYALQAGSKTIDAVEINTSTIDAVRNFADFNGRIYDRPEVRVYAEDGRNFLKKTDQVYDLIFLSLVKTEAIGTVAFALSENYIFTVEALEDYFNHLKDDGKIAFIVHHEACLAKMTATAMKVLKEKGIPEMEIPLYLAVVNSKNLETNPYKPTYEPLLLIKKKPFTRSEAETLLTAAKNTGNQSLFLPYLAENARLGDIRQGKMSVADFEKNLPYNAEPATNNKPYFYNFDPGLPPVLWYTLIGVTILALIFLKPLLNRKLTGISLYFTGLGIGFMFLEIPLIHKFILYLGHPTLAFTFVVFALLIGGGIGSYFSGLAIWEFGKSKRNIAALLVFGYTLLLLVAIPIVFKNTADFGSIVRIAISVLLVLPLGFFMGMPFPYGIKSMSLNGQENEVPLMWGVNGIMTVAGSIAAIIVSMFWGFDVTIAVGAAVYFGVFVGFKVVA